MLEVQVPYGRQLTTLDEQGELALAAYTQFSHSTCPHGPFLCPLCPSSQMEQAPGENCFLINRF